MKNDKSMISLLVKSGRTFNPTTNTWELPLVRKPQKKGIVAPVPNGDADKPILDNCEEGGNLDGSSLWCKITLIGVIRGLNGSGGLMQQHWSKARKEKERFVERIKALNPPKFTGQVRITYTRYCNRYMDWDNMVSTGKFPFDALVKCGVLVDDSPKYVVVLIPKQIISKNKDQRSVILIEAI